MATATYFSFREFASVYLSQPEIFARNL
jgi:hypothetical protein